MMIKLLRDIIVTNINCICFQILFLFKYISFDLPYNTNSRFDNLSKVQRLFTLKETPP